MARTPAFPKQTTTHLTHWEIAAIIKAVDAYQRFLEPTSGAALLAKLERASEIRVTTKEAR